VIWIHTTTTKTKRSTRPSPIQPNNTIPDFSLDPSLRIPSPNLSLQSRSTLSSSLFPKGIKMRQTQIFSSVFKTRSATLILLTNKLSRSPTSNRTKCRAHCTPSSSSNLRLPFLPSNRTHSSSASLKWVKILLKQVFSLVLSSRPLSFSHSLLGLLGQLIKQRLNSCTSCKKWASSWLVRDMSIKRPLRYPWKTTQPVLQWGSTNNLS
jgi:hypothetical protein